MTKSSYHNPFPPFVRNDRQTGWKLHFVFLLLVHVRSTAAFLPSVTIPFSGVSRTSKVFLAKKAQIKSKRSPGIAAGGGGGFGSKQSATDTTSSSSFQGKIRTVSGFQGSGTKVLRQAANAFDTLREKYGKECCRDLYCKSPLNDSEQLWFVGKIAVQPDTAATPEQAVISQKRVILEYSKRELRPQNLGGKYSESLELWLAPPDSEMDCVQNKVSLTKVEGSAADLHADFSVSQVGYNPEIYVGDEREKGGLRIRRDSEGNPLNPVFEITQ